MEKGYERKELKISSMEISAHNANYQLALDRLIARKFEEEFGFPIPKGAELHRSRDIFSEGVTVIVRYERKNEETSQS